jgi:hypothetical protein
MRTRGLWRLRVIWIPLLLGTFLPGKLAGDTCRPTRLNGSVGNRAQSQLMATSLLWSKHADPGPRMYLCRCTLEMAGAIRILRPPWCSVTSNSQA